MKLTSIALAVFVVKWTLLFSPDGGRTWVREFRQAEFTSQEAAVQLIRNSSSPKATFECKNSKTGEQGLCRVMNMWPEVRQ